jgi:hypothetical protein
MGTLTVRSRCAVSKNILSVCLNMSVPGRVVPRPWPLVWMTYFNTMKKTWSGLDWSVTIPLRWIGAQYLFWIHLADGAVVNSSVWHKAVIRLTSLETVRDVPRLCSRRLRKVAKGDYCLRHVWSSVRPSAWNNSAPTVWVFMKFDILLLIENLSWRFTFH